MYGQSEADVVEMYMDNTGVATWAMCSYLELEQGETVGQEQGGILLHSNKPSQHLLASRQTAVY